jgi:hypothetical protein
MIAHLNVTNFLPFIVDLILIEDLIFFSPLKIMVSRMVTSYGPQVAQVNEELPPESSLNLTLTQHPCDEKLEPREVCACFEVETPQA